MNRAKKHQNTNHDHPVNKSASHPVESLGSHPVENSAIVPLELSKAKHSAAITRCSQVD